ncbi:hypothetical protein SUGI_0764500 [Cryptomeria japonica]|nr:hypothetical protein SUGI_0764500 [Cryptomeria japonica]
MGKTYGPVMTAWMGPSPLIVLTGQASIWEALVNQAANFSGRPLVYSRKFTSASFRTMISSPYNEHWTKLRKVLRNNVLNPAHVALQSSFHQATVKKLINKLEKEMKEKNGVRKNSFSLARFFVPSSIRTERKLKSLRDDILHLLLPCIRYARSYKEYFKRSAPSSFLYCLLSIAEGEEGEDKSKLSDEEIAFCIYELFVLAVDSTSTDIEWALAYLISNPHVQERANQEISQAVGKGKGGLFSLEDLRKLPYWQSVVKKILRKESIAPLGIVHQTENECKLMDVTIPAKPERFLDKNESEKVRIAYLPFGAGRRVCAGMDVTSVYVPITLANLLKSFDWGFVKEGSLPDLSRDVSSLLMFMKYPLEARITPRPS